MKKSKKKNKNILSPKWWIIISLAVITLIVSFYFIVFKREYKIALETNGGIVKEEVLLKKHRITYLPTPEKEGYVFFGWAMDNGEIVDLDTIIDHDMSLIAVWQKYVCPDDCKVNSDGKTCNKMIVSTIARNIICPSGYTSKNNQCLDLKTKYKAIKIDTEPFYKCKNDNDGMYDEQEKNNTIKYCASKIGTIIMETCPTGFTKEPSVCMKKEVINCTLEK